MRTWPGTQQILSLLSQLLRWKPSLPAPGRHQHGFQTAGFWQPSSPQEWERPCSRPPQVLIKRGHTVASSDEEATFTSFYSRLPEGVETELIADFRFRKWPLVCLLCFCRCSELRPGWRLGAGGWVPSSEALLASSSWPGDYCLSLVGTENPFSNSDATIYHG